jgi:hypothetical protein
MVPNSVVISVAVTPLREPSSVDMRARLPVRVRPTIVQQHIQRSITVPTRSEPDIELVEFDGDEVLVRIAATPLRASDGAKLADEVLAAIAEVTGGEDFANGDRKGGDEAEGGDDALADPAKAQPDSPTEHLP